MSWPEVTIKLLLAENYKIISHFVSIGFKKGKNLNKVGMKAHDTAELFFEDVRLPESAILGGFNKGFYQLMTELPQVIALYMLNNIELKVNNYSNY